MFDFTTIIDCTLRDGGYYTNWDFSSALVTKYLSSLSNTRIDFVEIGYRSLYALPIAVLFTTAKRILSHLCPIVTCHCGDAQYF